MNNTLQRAQSCAIVVAVCLGVVGGGCAMMGGGEPSIHHAEGVRVSAPAGWKEQKHDDADRAFRTSSGGLVTFVSSCQHRDKPSLELLTKHLLFGTRNVRYSKREPIQVAGYEGLRSSVKATMDGVPFFLDVAVLRRESCVFDFTLMSRQEIPPTESAEFTAFIESFRHGKN